MKEKRFKVGQNGTSLPNVYSMMYTCTHDVHMYDYFLDLELTGYMFDTLSSDSSSRPHKISLRDIFIK